jgi:hypothetical protein
MQKLVLHVLEVIIMITVSWIISLINTIMHVNIITNTRPIININA